MLRQLLSGTNTGRDVVNVKHDRIYSSGSPTTILMAPPQPGTDLLFTQVPSSKPFAQEITAKTETSFSSPFAVELCTNEVIVKNDEGEKSLAILSNMPTNNCYIQQPAPAPLMMRYPGEEINGHISGTTELFSSTFAMLSADGVIPETDWSGQPNCDQKMAPVMYTVNANQGHVNDYGQPFAQQLIQITPQTYAESARFDQSYVNCGEQVVIQPPQTSQQPVYYQTAATANDVSQSSQNPGPSPSSDSSGRYAAKSGRSMQTAFSQGFRELAQIPVSSATSSGRNTPLADNENEADERVMCMACRGVYPSRRSLTGHIGRNEKCREIIGRNYLDQLGGCADKVSVDGSPAGTVGPAETISPICPYCDRFISHYKGNIRRHINQCLKSDRPKSRKNSSRKQESSPMDSMTSVQYSDGGLTPNGYSNSNDAFYDGYQPHALTTTAGDLQWDSAPVNSNSNNNSFPVSQPSPQPQPPKDGKNNDDPYLCSVCDFVTVYKGNMKRHLSTCHTITEEDLGTGGLDSLRASRRSGDLQSRIGKVSRGRRPKSVLEECRKKAKLELTKCCSPVTDNAPLPYESKSPEGSNLNLLDTNSRDSNSGSSSHDQFGRHENCSPVSGNGNSPFSAFGDPNISGVYTQQPCDTDCIGANANSNSAALSSDAKSVGDGNTGETGSSSSSNIDEIINAVASNQLGCTSRKPIKQQGRTSRGGGRRNMVPKTVCNMEEVRDYWEAERLSSGSAVLPTVYFGRSRNSQFSAMPSQLTTSAAGPALQH